MSAAYFFQSNLPKPQPINRAWECPRCKTINAWWVASCRCKGSTSPSIAEFPQIRRAR